MGRAGTENDTGTRFPCIFRTVREATVPSGTSETEFQDRYLKPLGQVVFRRGIMAGAEQIVCKARLRESGRADCRGHRRETVGRPFAAAVVAMW